MSKKIFFLLLIAVTLILAVMVIRFWSPEDSWICSGGQWVKHGNPSAVMPSTTCPGAENNNEENNTAGNETNDSSNQAGGAIGMANPASVNCTDQGGSLKIETLPNGGQFGVCYFEDNRQCEEWALFRGDCPVGGRKVTGYVTEAGRYCAITGGEYSVTDESEIKNEKGSCKLPSGEICDADAYYNSTCLIEN